LNEEVGKISKEEATNTMVEEMWLAGLTERRNAKRVAKALEEKRFNLIAEEFAPKALAVNNKNRNYPNVMRSANNQAYLRPEISEEQEKWDPIEMDEVKPAILFTHRKPDGTVVYHKRGEGANGEDGEWLGKKTITERLEYYVKNWNAEDFGTCPLGCGARLYPDEIEGFAPKAQYEEYRKAFNKRFSKTTGGGNKTQRRKRQHGGAKGMFKELEDARCARPWMDGRTRKKGGAAARDNKTHRKSKRQARQK
jgi:hypothetical protein